MFGRFDSSSERGPWSTESAGLELCAGIDSEFDDSTESLRYLEMRASRGDMIAAWSALEGSGGWQRPDARPPSKQRHYRPGLWQGVFAAPWSTPRLELSWWTPRVEQMLPRWSTPSFEEILPTDKIGFEVHRILSHRGARLIGWVNLSRAMSSLF